MDVNRDPIPRPEPLRASVYRRVVRLMTGGELEPGQTITEAGLSKALGVSRTPVREALLQLEAEGVLQSNPARGFTVRHLSASEAAELYPILGTLEGLAVRLAPAPDLDLLREMDLRFAATEDPVIRWRLDTAFHEKLIEDCPNASLHTMITRLRVTLSRYEIEYMRRAGTWKHTAGGGRHSAILDALAAGHLEAAVDAVANNWQGSLEAVRSWLAESN